MNLSEIRDRHKSAEDYYECMGNDARSPAHKDRGELLRMLSILVPLQSADNIADLLHRLKERPQLPSAYQLVGHFSEDLFDIALRHRSDVNPHERLARWLSILRPFAYATRDDSWGEMEKELATVMKNYVKMIRLLDDIAVAAGVSDLEEP